MTPLEIETILNAAEREIALGEAPNLATSGFWPAVADVKADRALIDQFAQRIGSIDRAGFSAWARLVIPIRFGTVLAVIGTLFGISLISASALITMWNEIVFLAGTGVLIGATHGLGHLAIGYFGGIRFHAWFIGKGRPQPGVKTDYATYLSATPRSRAWVHASGAIITKAIPFVLLPVAIWISTVAAWVPVVLIVLGIAQIITDIAWSTRSSDWAKFKREMKYV